MTTNTLHTPLEVLLFFQSLRIQGVDGSSFSRISELLRENEYVHQDTTYDAERLSSENLKSLYLNLLKDEVRSQKNLRASPAKDGGSRPKKRKLSTPPLQTLDEAAEHTHLLPQLVNHLYARYRDHVLQAIHAEERRYSELSKEINEIERGEWDARLRQEEARAQRKASRSSIQDLLLDESDEKANGAKPGQETVVGLQGKGVPPATGPNGHRPFSGAQDAPANAQPADTFKAPLAVPVQAQPSSFAKPVPSIHPEITHAQPSSHLTALAQ